MEWCDDARILIALQDLRLVALNARTGGLYPDFGHGGFVDLDLGLGREINLLRSRPTPSSGACLGPPLKA